MYSTTAQSESGRPDADDDFPLSAVAASRPEPLAVSPSRENPSIASLEILVANDTGEAVSFAKLALVFTAEKSNWGNDNAALLTPEWDRCKWTAAPPDTWKKNPDETGIGRCVYRAADIGGGKTGLKDGETFRFHLHDIPVSAKLGVTTASVQLLKEDNDLIAERTFTMGKFPSGYYLRDFRAVAPVMSIGQAEKNGTTLTWTVQPDPTVTYTMSVNGGDPRPLANTQTIFNTGRLRSTATYQLTATHADDSALKHTLLTEVHVVGGDITARNVTVNGNLDVAGKTNANGDLTVKYDNTLKLQTSGQNQVVFPQGLDSNGKVNAYSDLMVKSGDKVTLQAAGQNAVEFPQGLNADRQIYARGDLAVNGRTLIGYFSGYDGMSEGDIWIKNRATIGWSGALDIKNGLVNRMTELDIGQTFTADTAGLVVGRAFIAHSSGSAAARGLWAKVSIPGLDSFEVETKCDDDENAGTFTVPVNKGTTVEFKVYSYGNVNSTNYQKAYWLPFG
ncbi:hypothetical protein [Nocardiopsis potens]|uniref:hypothetical protein n=1 Tax=Nocardiopsis potens TaxID=1246458 RepID=UPI000349B0E4|nr:hypothetical protein [Nocardiopsis potens]